MLATMNVIPPQKPVQPYSYPKLVKTVTVTKLQTTTYVAGKPGTRVPMAVKKVTKTTLVTSIRMVVPPALALIALIKLAKPAISLLASMGTQQTGKPPKGAHQGRRAFDPYGDFAFHVEIEGIGAGSFAKFDGIDLEIDQIEYKDSLDPHPHKRPGIYRFGNIKLTKGVIANKALWEWCEKIMAGKLERKNGSIHVLADTHDKAAAEITYNFFSAWPCKWTGLKLDGKGTATLVEELELCVDYVKRSK